MIMVAERRRVSRPVI